MTKNGTPQFNFELFEKAKTAKTNAYAPYSKFLVGCALISSKGNVYTGCNVENASYPVGICAEVNAIGNMLNAGDTEIREIAVCGSGEDACTPCGNCRQFIAEFATKDTIIYISDGHAAYHALTLADLLPRAFLIRDKTPGGV